MLFVLVFLLPFPLARLTEWAATHAANQIWDGQTVDLVPVLKEEGVASTAVVQESAARALAVPGSDSSVNYERAELIANYLACLQAGELGLIFSAEAHYYLLCRSNLDRDTGNIFEVTGKEGLISVRESVYRQAGEEGR